MSAFGRGGRLLNIIASAVAASCSARPLWRARSGACACDAAVVFLADRHGLIHGLCTVSRIKLFRATAYERGRVQTLRLPVC